MMASMIVNQEVFLPRISSKAGTAQILMMTMMHPNRMVPVQAAALDRIIDQTGVGKKSGDKFQIH